MVTRLDTAIKIAVKLSLRHKTPVAIVLHGTAYGFEVQPDEHDAELCVMTINATPGKATPPLTTR